MLDVCHETRARIRVALWAYAYEVKQDPLVDDATFDAVAATIDVTTTTKRPDLDEFFRREFSPHTGQWVWKHPEIGKLEAMYIMQRAPEANNLLRIGDKLYEIGEK